MQASCHFISSEVETSSELIMIEINHALYNVPWASTRKEATGHYQA